MNIIGSEEEGVKEDGLENTCELRRYKKKKYLQLFHLKLIFLKFEKNLLSETLIQHEEDLIFFWNTLSVSLICHSGIFNAYFL